MKCITVRFGEDTPRQFDHITIKGNGTLPLTAADYTTVGQRISPKLVAQMQDPAVHHGDHCTTGHVELASLGHDAQGYVITSERGNDRKRSNQDVLILIRGAHNNGGHLLGTTVGHAYDCQRAEGPQLAERTSRILRRTRLVPARHCDSCDTPLDTAGNHPTLRPLNPGTESNGCLTLKVTPTGHSQDALVVLRPGGHVLADSIVAGFPSYNISWDGVSLDITADSSRAADDAEDLVLV